MIDKLTKTFFDTFGIEPMPYCCYHDCNCPINDVGKFNNKCPKQAVTKECDARIIRKPQITDRILLELICILNDYTGIDVRATKNEELKKELLNHCIELIEYELYNDDDITNFKHRVRTLFEEV